MRASFFRLCKRPYEPRSSLSSVARGPSASGQAAVQSSAPYRLRGWHSGQAGPTTQGQQTSACPVPDLAPLPAGPFLPRPPPFFSLPSTVFSPPKINDIQPFVCFLHFLPGATSLLGPAASFVALVAGIFSLHSFFYPSHTHRQHVETRDWRDAIQRALGPPERVLCPPRWHRP